mmetsp:Transcript_2974/g.5081  ORF Transcript_2974/g.5081 Transcript_2974/m.5081 type:complete len:218 (-) Transcript_2974:259-912(-)|eukprot:CAMPEP_0194561120 /NCGR_PEP_ID=MMETSP0292-20121207/2039_1 /TAXON_ID=39354 /ORGANISM="Heterosigma akashiwo, Strain CCMP2393" /LENGTH=217 /DNA_ID=CAMNT_0039409459 /DNA_START=287 /DNA_END=940 /DNA_ORIENTATION=+
MAKSAVLAALMMGSASAFVAPTGMKAVAKSSKMTMKLGEAAQGLVGTDLEFPEFDPLGFTKNVSQEQLEWYRAAELKHGRVAMLAALGQIFQSFYTLPDPVFAEKANPWQAMIKVYEERPLAMVQILLAAFACEAAGAFIQARPGQAPGDLGFDPLNLKSNDPEIFERVQLRELKNGRLAMWAIAAMIVQENLTGYGVIEAYRQGVINPFGDGKGYF